MTVFVYRHPAGLMPAHLGLWRKLLHLYQSSSSPLNGRAFSDAPQIQKATSPTKSRGRKATWTHVWCKNCIGRLAAFNIWVQRAHKNNIPVRNPSSCFTSSCLLSRPLTNNHPYGCSEHCRPLGGPRSPLEVTSPYNAWSNTVSCCVFIGSDSILCGKTFPHGFDMLLACSGNCLITPTLNTWVH